MTRKPYPSDLTDEQWAVLQPLLPRGLRPGGRPCKTDLREVLNAALLPSTVPAVPGERLPHDFPLLGRPSTTTSRLDSGRRLAQALARLRPLARAAAGREPTPRVAALDSQSVKTAEGGEQVGIDGGKKVDGRKRHILVDSLGFLLAVVVSAANVDDARGRAGGLGRRCGGRGFPRGCGWSATPTASATTTNCIHGLATHQRPYELYIVQQSADPEGFKPLPQPLGGGTHLRHRLGRSRRLPGKDYELRRPLARRWSNWRRSGICSAA